MPTVGSFHRFFWKGRPNAVVPPGVGQTSMYPQWQSTVTAMAVTFWPPFTVLRPYWQQVRWLWGLVYRLWSWRDPQQHVRLEQWVARVEVLTPLELQVLDRVVAVLRGPWWEEAQARVAVCAHTPKMEGHEQWLAYSRALKSNPGQAQNVYRHVRVVHELHDASQHALTNPEAHLLAELAYQAYAVLGRPDRRLVMH